jgi:hypothetical protein
MKFDGYYIHHIRSYPVKTEMFFFYFSKNE